MDRPRDGPVAASDSELAALAAGPVAETGVAPVLSVAGGDVLRTLGLDGPRLHGETIGFPIDLGLLRLAEPGPAGSVPPPVPTPEELSPTDPRDDGVRPAGDGGAGRVIPFVAHVLATGSWWARPGGDGDGSGDGGRRWLWRWPAEIRSGQSLTCVMNAPWRGPLRLGPRAHLNDGVLDVTHGRLPLTQVREARRRALTGTHVPHPGLEVHRVRTWAAGFDAPRQVWVDGRPVGRSRAVSVAVIPDALVVVA